MNNNREEIVKEVRRLASSLNESLYELMDKYVYNYEKRELLRGLIDSLNITIADKACLDILKDGSISSDIEKDIVFELVLISDYITINYATLSVLANIIVKINGQH